MKNDGRGRLGGRQKGTPNKATADLKEWIRRLIDDNSEKVETDIMQLEPKDRLAFIEKMMRFVVPQETKITQEGGASDLMASIEEGEPILAEWIRLRYIDNANASGLGAVNYIDHYIASKLHPEGNFIFSEFTHQDYTPEEFERLPEATRRYMLIREWLQPDAIPPQESAEP